MSWKLLFALSSFAAFMAVGSVFFIPPMIEPVLWLAIFLLCGWQIAKRAPGRFFVHGLVLSLINCVWITTAHLVFAETYLAHHPQEAAMSGPMGSPRLMMAIVGPIVGVVSGLVQGLIAFIASKIVKRPAVAA
jgi:hypothetical protein